MDRVACRLALDHHFVASIPAYFIFYASVRDDPSLITRREPATPRRYRRSRARTGRISRGRRRRYRRAPPVRPRRTQRPAPDRRPGCDRPRSPSHDGTTGCRRRRRSERRGPHRRGRPTSSRTGGACRPGVPRRAATPATRRCVPAPRRSRRSSADLVSGMRHPYGSRNHGSTQLPSGDGGRSRLSREDPVPSGPGPPDASSPSPVAREARRARYRDRTGACGWP